MASLGGPARTAQLDGLRGIAILAVLFFHFFWGYRELWDGPLTHVIARATRPLWWGVDLFFVLSGFLIGGILIRNRAATNYFRTFYLRRACRILPALFVLLLLNWGIGAGAAAAMPPTLRDFFLKEQLPLGWYALFLQNAGMALKSTWGAPSLSVTWSLAIEEQFYLLLPLVIRFARPAQLPIVVGGLALLAPVIRGATWAFGWRLGMDPRIAAFVGLPQRMDSLLIGVAIALALSRQDVRNVIRRNIPFVRTTTAVLCAGVGVLAIAWPDAGCEAVTGGGGLTWIALAFGGILVLTLEPGTALNRVTGSPILRWFGLRCYSLYLFHSATMALPMATPEMAWSRSFGLAPRVLWAIGWLLTLVFAELVYRLVELPTLRLGWRVNYRQGSESPACDP